MDSFYTFLDLDNMLVPFISPCTSTVLSYNLYDELLNHVVPHKAQAVTVASVALNLSLNKPHLPLLPSAALMHCSPCCSGAAPNSQSVSQSAQRSAAQHVLGFAPQELTGSGEGVSHGQGS